jgi:fibronectin-binding autotransporter adhesin
VSKHHISAPVLFVVFICALLAAHPAAAATRTWTGGSGSSNNGSDAANGGGTTPVAGDDLVFPGGAARLSNTNDLAAGTSFNSITFNGASGGYSLGGNAITLVAGITTSNTSGFNVTTFPVTLSASQSFNLTAELDLNGPLAVGANTLTVTCGTATSFFQDVISGNGAFIKNGLATLVFSGATANTFSGTTTVNAGTLRPDKAAGVAGIAGPVVVNGGNLQLGANEQILDTVSVTVTSGGFSVAGFTETIASLTGGGSVNLGSGSLIVNSPNISFSFSGVIADTGGLTKAGLGTLLLTGANTYSGPTNVTGGQLFIGGGSLNRQARSPSPVAGHSSSPTA